MTFKSTVHIPFLFLLLLGGIACSTEQAADQRETTVVYLVRHAEKADDGTDDPPLTEEGTARSELLKYMLADVEPDHLHSTDFLRTRLTAAPIEAATGLDLNIYEAGSRTALSEFAAYLKMTPGRHLVVGHSNTTPALVELLGGEPGTPIQETEYNRFYIVTLPRQGEPVTHLIRFGTP